MVSGRVVATISSPPSTGAPGAAAPARLFAASPQQRAVLDGGVDLEVRHHGLARGIPVDHPLGAEDQALLVEPDERLDHGAVGALVRREALARPVEREAHQLLLL